MTRPESKVGTTRFELKVETVRHGPKFKMSWPQVEG